MSIKIITASARYNWRMRWLAFVRFLRALRCHLRHGGHLTEHVWLRHDLGFCKRCGRWLNVQPKRYCRTCGRPMVTEDYQDPHNRNEYAPIWREVHANSNTLADSWVFPGKVCGEPATSERTYRVSA